MKVRLHDFDGNVIKEFVLENEIIPTPMIIIDGATDIMYNLQQSGNAYDYYPVPYLILGTKSEAAIGIDGLMYWSRQGTVNA